MVDKTDSSGGHKPSIMLLFAPHYSPLTSHPATAYLTGYLKENGFDVSQSDLGSRFYDYVLSPEYLKRCVEKLPADSPLRPGARAVIENVEKAKNGMRDEEVYKDYDRFVASKEVLQDGLRIVNAVSKDKIGLEGKDRKSTRLNSSH